MSADQLNEEDREWLRRNVDNAPPLTESQRTALAELLRPARRWTGDGARVDK